MHIIAADVGGTKTRLAFANSKTPDKVLFETRYASNDFDGFEPMLDAFIQHSRATIDGVETPDKQAHGVADIDILSLALPGLIGDTCARLTNLPWVIDKHQLKDSFGFKHVYFMNDFQASASGTALLLENERILLNAGKIASDNLQKNSIRVAVGAGTGLGIAWTEGDSDSIYIGQNVIHSTNDSEGGHIDFAPTSAEQIQLLQYLQKRYRHVSYERILSGDGLISLYRFCSGDENSAIDAEWVNTQSRNPDSEFYPAADQALTLFVEIYGAYIGNIAMLFKPYGGIYITGGIAAKIKQKMCSNVFLDAYLNKGRMRTLVEQVTVYLVTNDRVGMLGAMTEAIKRQTNYHYS